MSISKLTAKVPETAKDYIINNMYLVLPIFTFLVFNFFKDNFFEGYAINFIELFHMIIATTLVFSLTLKNICEKSYDPTENTLQHPLKYALILLFIVNLFNTLNPCKQYMTYTQSNLFFLVLLIFTFNVINYIINKKKIDYCKNEDNKVIIFFLLLLHIGLIYVGKYY